MYYKTLAIYKFTEAKISVHIGFIELCTAVTTVGKISNQATEVKMACI